MYVLSLSLLAAAPLLLIPAPSTAKSTLPVRLGPVSTAHALARRPGLGNILTTSDGGQIFGFDVNQRGNDGVLASAQTVSRFGDQVVSVETFDQDNGAITKVFAQYRGKRDSYTVQAFSPATSDS